MGQKNQNFSDFATPRLRLSQRAAISRWALSYIHTGFVGIWRVFIYKCLYGSERSEDDLRQTDVKSDYQSTSGYTSVNSHQPLTERSFQLYSCSGSIYVCACVVAIVSSIL